MVFGVLLKLEFMRSVFARKMFGSERTQVTVKKTKQSKEGKEKSRDVMTKIN